jgi:predicted naringenin-chalcone synthase
MIHRYNMAVKLNRPLMKDEVVHHIDGNKQNNSIENLELWNKSHPSGQRIIDKINWALKFLKNYNPNFNMRSYKCPFAY